MAERKLTLDMVAQKFAQASSRQAPATPGPTAEDWAYREAAAVLISFEPNQLKPNRLPPSDDLSAVARMRPDCVLVYDKFNEPRWALRSGARRQALQRLGSRTNMQAALEANPDRPADPAQEVLEAAILGKLPPLERQTNVEELQATLQAVRWLEGTLPFLPSPDEVQRRLDWLRLLEPFHWLVGVEFCGRKRELDRLREYVGALPARDAVRSFVRGVREFLSLHEQPPLMIHGPGGIGKSTLLAAFVLEHVEGGAGSRFPFAYLDFDRTDLTAQEPATLLIEAVRQLGIQYPGVAEQSRKVVRHWTRELSGAQIDPWLQRPDYGTEQVIQASLSDRVPLLDDVQKVVDQVGEQDRPFLLILDTFEVVQQRSRDWVAELWNVLNELQARVPRLRTVIAGRAPVRAFQSREMPLGDLKSDAAECLLRAQGVKNPDLVRRLVSQVGGNPLSLELAAEIVHSEGMGEEGITDLTVWRRMRLQIQENGIQGYLYRRLLSRIRDEDVRELAHPGLILRRVTPELIKHVLAEPCGIELTEEGQEYELFDKLSREVTLVTFETDGSLRHRSDVRQIMLDSLTRDEPLKVRQIHERAADYYHERDTIQDRAEEIYHRLFLEADLAKLDGLWKPGLLPYLEGAVDEVPQRAKSYLASHIGITREDLEWNALEIEEWERLAEERVRQLMGYSNFDEALEVLAERDERSPGSPLHLLEATVLAELERWPEARRAVKQGLYWAEDGDPLLMVELLRLSARIDEQTGQLAQARQMWQRALDLVSDPEFPKGEMFSDGPLDDALLHLEIALGLLRLADVEPPLNRGEVETLRKEATGLFEMAAPILGQVNVHLLREGALRLGMDNPSLLRKALAGVEGLAVGPDQREKLGAAMAAWDRQVSRELGTDPGVLAEEAGLQVDDGLEAAWTEYLHTTGTGYLSRLLSRLLEKHPVPGSVVAVLVDVLLPEERDAPLAAL